jgi:hypothetical protein
MSSQRGWTVRALVVCLLVVCVLLVAAFQVGKVWAGGVPATSALTYSGTLQDSSGAALTGQHNVEVKLWAALSGGTPLCDSGAQTLMLTAGRFNIALPDTCTAAIDANRDTWSEVYVEGASLGRAKLGAVPYAIEAAHATSADNVVTGAPLDTRLTTLMPKKSIITAYLSAMEVSTNFDNTGLANMGSAYAGWAICNGGNGTPDLSGRFIRINATGSGATGGTDSSAHVHPIDHDHEPFMSATEAGHTHGTPAHHHLLPGGFDSANQFWSDDGSGLPLFGSVTMSNSRSVGVAMAPAVAATRLAFTDMSGQGVTDPGTPHAHTVDPPAFTGTSGAASATDNRPAFFELVALMRL